MEDIRWSFITSDSSVVRLGGGDDGEFPRSRKASLAMGRLRVVLEVLTSTARTSPSFPG